MDKLQPIIRQRFWILLGLCIVLGTFAFFKGQSAIVAATQSREELLKKTKDGVSSGREPNDDYKAKLAYINVEYGKRVRKATRELFESQKARMWWPDLVKAEIPAKHRDPEARIAPATSRKYETRYNQMIDDLWKKVDPVVPKRTPGAPLAAGQPVGPITWTQKVYCSKEDLPQKLLSKTPDSDAVWDAQEDIWFVELVLEAIHDANRQASSPLDAMVRTVEKLELRGGEGRSSAGGETEEAGGDMATEYSRTMAKAMGGGLGGMGAPRGVGAGPGFTASVAFDADEEFGGAGFGRESSAGEDEDDTELPLAIPAGFGGMGGMGSAAGPGLRWIAKNDEAPFRERGFYLSVIIQQSRIPDFMIELTKAPWPVQVLRFHMGPNPRAQATPSIGAPGGMAGLAGMGGGNPQAAAIAARRAQSGGPELSGMAAMMAGARARPGVSRMPGAGLNFINTATDPFPGSLNSPDLVQLDIVGIITFYVPQNADGTAAVETPDADTPAVADPAVTAPDATENKPADGSAPAAPGAPAPNAGEQPPAATSPPAAGTAPSGSAPPAATTN